MKWSKYQPHFEFIPDCKSHVWFGHCFFAYDLVRNTKPHIIVELGTYYATSFSSFCQGVKDEGLDSELYAIDSWQGDDHAGYYGEYVYLHADAMIKKYYPSQKTKLMKMYFDEAVSSFQDKSIDLLHIDGLHTYEAVKHDFETWLPKVKENGVIMLHDTCVEHFGVKDLWKEIKEKQPNWRFINFEHSFGLGVIFLDKSIFEELFEKNFDENDLIKYYSEIANQSVGMKQIIEVEADREFIRKELEMTLDSLKKIEKKKNELRDQLIKTQQLVKELQQENKEFKNYQDRYLKLRSRKIVRLINNLYKLFGKTLY